MRRPRLSRGFTLVELLVVIGIIALLISILLPALGAARRSAAQTKCAAQMKQFGNAMLLYAIDNHGYWAPPRVGTGANTTTNKQYDLYDNMYTGTAPYWYDFLSKYLTKAKLGTTSANGQEAAEARRSVIWGCPAWDGYVSTAIGGVNRTQTGYGMNQWPSFAEENPPYASTTQFFPPAKEAAAITNFGSTSATSPQVGTWYPGSRWGRGGANRMLIADSQFWLAESNPAPADGTFPPQPQPFNIVTYTTGINGQTLVDVYRHGKVAPTGAVPRTFAQTGGKVGYNILYADGHVSGQTEQRPAYESIRQRYPN